MSGGGGQGGRSGEQASSLERDASVEQAASVGRVRVAVFASGSGTNFAALLQAARAPNYPAQIACLVTDKPGCGAVERARRAGVDVVAARPAEFVDKAAFEAAVLVELRDRQVEWIALAGYMRLIGPTLLTAYAGRMVNIHPSLLPAFPGRHAVADALAAGVPETGVTVHFVDAGIDTGPVIEQRSVPVDPGMTEAQLLARLHAVEHELYPAVLQRLVAARG